MAEPAPIYDPDKKEPIVRPDLQVLEGGGETSSPTGNLSTAPEPADLAQKEESPLHSDQVGSGYKPGGQKNSLRSRLFKNRKRTALIGGGATGLAALLIAGFLFLLPMKVLHIVNNLQSRFYATSENAMDREVDRLFSNYIKKKISLGTCRGSHIDSSCNPFNAGDSLVKRLYRGWSNGKLEDKLREKYGLEFRYNSATNNYYLKTRSLPGDGVNLKGFIDSNDSLNEFIDKSPEFNKFGGRNEFRQAVKQGLREGMEGEARWKKVMYRYKVLKLLERKYGIKFCIVGCKVQDKFTDWKTNKKRAMKMILVQRVLTPRIEMYGLLYECLLSETCNSKTFTSPSPEPYEADITGCKNGCATNGGAMTESDREIRDRILISRLLSVYSGDVDALTREYAALQEKGILGLMQERAKSKAGNDEMDKKGRERLLKLVDTQAFKKGINLIPIVGQVNTAALIVGSTATMKDAIPKMVYVMNSTAAAQFFAMYRTHADEIKEGNVDAEIVGSFTDSLGPGIQTDANKNNQIGGLAGAEQTPLYAELIGNENNKPGSLLSNIIAPSAHAADNRYLCSNGAPPRGSPVCPEEKIRQNGNSLNKGINKMFSGPVWDNVLVPAAGAWNDAKNGIFHWITEGLGVVGSIFCAPLWGLNPLAPVCQGAQDAANQVISLVGPFVGDKLQKALEFIFENIFGFNINQISNHMSGGRAFDMLAAGADVSGNEFAHHGLGGKVLSPRQVTAIRDEQRQQEQYRYQQQSFFARMFDSESSQSLVSKIALSMPSSTTEAARGTIASLIQNPFAKISHIFASIFKIGRASAAPPSCAATGSSRYFLDDSGNGLFYWSSDPEVDAHGGLVVATRQDGSYGVVFYDAPGREGQVKGSAEGFMAPDYCDPSEGAGSGVDPFGVTQYGYPSDDPSFKEDPDEYWQNHCMGPDSDTIRWNQTGAAAADKTSSYEPVNTTTNRCLLIQAAVGSAGAIYDETLLSPEELEGSSSSAPVESGPEIVGDIGQSSDSVACAADTKDLGIVTSRYNGQYKTSSGPLLIRLCQVSSIPGSGDNVSGATIGGGAVVNSRVAGAWQALGKKAKASGLSLSSTSSFRLEDSCGGEGDGTACAKPGTSLHQMGIAIDFAGMGTKGSSTTSCSGRARELGNPTWQWLYKNAESFGFKQYTYESWHWDSLKAANRCGFGE